jgi:hypothetical protein
MDRSDVVPRSWRGAFGKEQLRLLDIAKWQQETFRNKNGQADLIHLKISGGELKHDPEECAAVFRKDHAQTTT